MENVFDTNSVLQSYLYEFCITELPLDRPKSIANHNDSSIRAPYPLSPRA